MNFLIALGASKVRIDPIRYITNPSTGKMGLAFVEAVKKEASSIRVVAGEDVYQRRHEYGDLWDDNTRCYKAVTVMDFLWQILMHAEDTDVLIMTAAISDFIYPYYCHKKLKKEDRKEFTLQLKAGPDILSSVVKAYPHLYTLGFAAETENVLPYAHQKKNRKGVDALFVNDVSGSKAGGFMVDVNQGVLLTREKEIFFPLVSKKDLALSIWNFLSADAQEKKCY